MCSWSRPSTSVLGSLRSLPLAVTGTVSMAAGATPETRSLVREPVAHVVCDLCVEVAGAF